MTLRSLYSLNLMVLLLAVVAVGCSDSNGQDQAADAEAAPGRANVRVETLVLTPAGFEDVVQLTGAVEAVGDARLSAQASGTVVSVAALGRFVQAGQTVAQLDPGMARASVQQAEATVEAARARFDLAEDNLQRQEPLYRDSVISAIEFQNVRAQYNQAQAELNRAKAGLAQVQEQLKYTRVTAPFAGTIEERFAEPGEQVMPGAPVVRIVNTGQIKVKAGVPERYAPDIRVGTSVRVSFNAFGTETRLGRVSFVGNAIDAGSRTFPVEITMSNPDGRLKPEMVANLEVTRSEVTDALVVPRSAVIRDENGTSVFVVAQVDGRARAQRRTVQLGSSHAGKVVVQGLTAGDEVVILGQTNLTDGDPVQVIEQYRSVGAASEPLTDDPAALPPADAR